MTTPTKTARTAADATSANIPADVDTRTAAEREADETQAAANRDAAGATMVQAPGEGDIAAGDVVLTPGVLPELEGDEGDWAKVIILAGGGKSLPTKNGAKVIVAETRTQPGEDGTGAGQYDAEASYPKNADAYVGHFGFDAENKPNGLFADIDGPKFIIGDNVKQFGIGGVSRQPGFLSVGNGSSIVAAANLALQKGAKEVTVVGMTDHDKATTGRFLDRIAGEFETLDYGQAKD